MTNNFFRLSLICGFIGVVLRFGIIYVNAIECGTTVFTRKLILRGTKTERGEYPFLAALYLIEDMKFICGGSLISMKHVLTAAHCTKDRGIMFVPDDLIVLLGSYDLTSRIERGGVQRDVSEIRVHPDWKVYSEKLDADLAILVLSEIVAFTNFIRPVCMPADYSVISGAKGSIVGWGLTENGTQPHLTYPKHAVTNALNDSTDTTDYVAASLSSLRTFCGGGEETSPNQGDSGGGFFVLYGKAWVQYGIISALRLDATGNVDAHSIAIYTNVKEFRSWISDTVRESGGEIGEAIGMKKTKIELNCDYTYGTINISLYGCFVDGVDIRSDNFEVALFTGSHQHGKTDNDVGLLQFRNGTMFYLPDGIGNTFKNLKLVEIQKSLNTQLIRRSNFEYLKSLIDLSIFENNIETLEEDLLWDLPHLEMFILLKNKLRDIKENTFVNNPKLREIYLNENHLESIPRNLLQNNLLLEKVSLTDNSLKAIDEVTFINNPKLREINLNKNHIESIPRNLFQNNLLLETVTLAVNNLKTIDQVTFVNNAKLRDILLYENHIESIPRNLFQNNSLLEKVSLTGNNLKTIDEVTFISNSKLREIYLNENRIELIPRHLFQKNLLLEVVSLAVNNLKIIDEVTFVNNPKLRKIYLNENHIDSILKNLFQNNLLLEVVSLAVNNLKIIDEVTFVNNPKLREIYLNENHIESIPKNLFQNNFLLEIVTLAVNNLKTIDEVTFVNSSNLREIYLYDNFLESIPKNLFQNNLLLEIVSLHRNNLKAIDEVTFVNNPKLREIYLYENHIESIPRNLFQNNLLLEKIELYKNSIRTIEVDFTVIKNLKYIYLHDNICIDGYYDTEDPIEYRNKFTNLSEFQETIRVNCSSVKP